MSSSFAETSSQPSSYQNSPTGDVRPQLKYDWRTYSPDDRSLGKFLRWLVVGGASFVKETNEDLMQNLSQLARCLSLLRLYFTTFGMPEKGSVKDQEVVLRNIAIDLYSGGAPIWSLDGAMQKVAEGLTSEPGVNWFFLPRRAYMFSPLAGTTSMFKIDRGFNVQKLQDMERVAVRLASYASNTQGLSNIPSRFPSPDELLKVVTGASSKPGGRADGWSSFAEGSNLDQQELADEILALASQAQGLFFFLNSKEYKTNVKDKHNDFWIISEMERELFTRLATMDAIKMIDLIDERKKVLYSPTVLILARLVTAAGACAFWFGGSWPDMIVAGLLAVCVGFIGESKFLSKQERIIVEVVGSLVVGLIAGLISIKWPDDTCFAAMALGGVLDILQGFRVVYSAIEIMSKHTVCGTADLLEGILFTGLIAYFLRFGQNLAAGIMGKEEAVVYLSCQNGIDPFWYIFLVPLTALSWSASFTPAYEDLPVMGFHGCLAYAVNYGLSQAGLSNTINDFLSAMCVSLSAGLFSRFTGKAAVGPTVAGLYVLVPGAYLVRSLFSENLDGNFFNDIIQRAIVIGLGAWSGTILCSPTVLGTTRGLLTQQSSHRSQRRHHDSIHQGPMLFF